MGQKVVLEIVTAFKSAATRNVVFSTTVKKKKPKASVISFSSILSDFYDKG